MSAWGRADVGDRVRVGFLYARESEGELCGCYGRSCRIPTILGGGGGGGGGSGDVRHTDVWLKKWLPPWHLQGY